MPMVTECSAASLNVSLGSYWEVLLRRRDEAREVR